VTKIYGGGTPAVNDVSLDIDDGELMILLDPGRMHLFDPESGENLTHGRGVDARALASA
jgi:hypothetical protein